MIRGVHTMFYSSDATTLRAFLRDKLGFNATDVGGGWLIFDLPEADMGVHPADPNGQHGMPAGTHAISFYCDDLEATVAELKEKGVEFTSEIQNARFGMTTSFRAADLEMQLYQPLYLKGGEAKGAEASAR